MEKLKFGALVRVSTEKQASRGESLRTQTKQLTEMVKLAGGIVVEWYSGQEHATPLQERQIFDRLLQDCEAKKFDAVIVTDLTRWARDNAKAKAGYETLRQTGIRFFEGTREWDLWSPRDRMFLGLSGEMAEGLKLQEIEKSFVNRVARAKRGIPSFGKLPFGRTFDKASEKWGLDPEKKALVESVARDYLSGDRIENISKRIGIKKAYLYHILKYDLGPEHHQVWKSKLCNMTEVVTIKIPALLDEVTIKRIRQRMDANRTYLHGSVGKNKYLLSRMVFCGHCGYALHGTVNEHGKRYYRHILGEAAASKNCHCKEIVYVPAEDLELQVTWELFQIFGDKKRIEQVLKDGSEQLKEAEGLKVKLQMEMNKREQVQTRIDNLMMKVADGAIKDADLTRTLPPLREQKEALNKSIEATGKALADMPTKEMIKDRAATLKVKPDLKKKINKWTPEMGRELEKRHMENYLKSESRHVEMFNDPKWFEAWREILQDVFSGHDRDGKRLGVYVTKMGKGKGKDSKGKGWDKRRNRWLYTIKGHFQEIVGNFFGAKPGRKQAPRVCLVEMRHSASRIGRAIRNPSRQWLSPGLTLIQSSLPRPSKSMILTSSFFMSEMTPFCSITSRVRG